jgi:hypothetical protein
VFATEDTNSFTGISINTGFTVLDTNNTAINGFWGASAYLITTTSTAPVAPTWTYLTNSAKEQAAMATFRSIAVAAHQPVSGTGIW